MQTGLPIMLGLSGILVSACAELPTGHQQTLKRGAFVYSKECAQCHGVDARGGGPESLGIGVIPPDLTILSLANGGAFPREFVRRFVMGLLENDALDPTMPEFATVGLAHVYPDGGAYGEILAGDFGDLLAYLESIQGLE
jgi:mono/diheme cytochrome c family protein